MGKIVDVLQVVLPVVAMILLGILARKKKILSPTGVEDIKSLIVNICLPAVIFSTFYATEFNGTAVLLCAVMAVFTLGAWLVGGVIQRVLHIEQPMTSYLCTTIEGGMLGFALFILMFGQENLYHLALFDLGNTLIVFPVLLTSLRMRAQGTVSGREVIKGLITPINVAIAAGLTVNACGLGRVIHDSVVGDVLGSVLSFVSGPTGALILLVVGFGLEFSDVRWSETLRTVAARVLIFGVCGVLVYQLVMSLLPHDPLYGFAVIMAFILPPSFVFSAYTNGRREESYVGSVLAVYTLLTLVGYSILAWIAA